MRSSSRRAATDAASVPACTSAVTAGSADCTAALDLKRCRRPASMRSHSQAWSCSRRRRCSAPLCDCRSRKSLAICQKASMPVPRNALSSSTEVAARSRLRPARRCVVQGRADLGPRTGGSDRVQVDLVDQHQVGDLHHALLDRLQVVAGVGQLHQHIQVGHAGHGDLALADTDGLDDHQVVAGGLAQAQALARLRRHAAERAAGGARADEGALVHRQLLHSRLVAQDRAAADARRRVHRQHRHAITGGGAHQAQGFDEGALAHTGHAADAEPEAAVVGRRQSREQFVGLQPVLGQARFEQSNRLGQRSPLTLPRRAQQCLQPQRSRNGAGRHQARRAFQLVHTMQLKRIQVEPRNRLRRAAGERNPGGAATERERGGPIGGANPHRMSACALMSGW